MQINCQAEVLFSTVVWATDVRGFSAAMIVNPPEIQHQPKRFHYKRLLLIGAGVIVALFAGALVAVHFAQPFIRNRLIASLKESYESDVTLKNFNITFFPTIHAKGAGLVLKYKGRNDVPPLIIVEKFSVSASWWGLLRTHVDRARLVGLQIHVPPRREDAGLKGAESRHRNVSRIIVDEVNADGTLLETLPRKPGKEPLKFQISQLTLWDAGAADRMSFRAVLTNAKPVGEIHSEGQFGPWQADEPSLTPVAGRYTFQHADLSNFKGISGTLSSEGAYSGALYAIHVQGTTDVPDFKLNVSNTPVHLMTQFRAEVDGTDGDTRLEPVTAKLGHSTVTATGSVEGKAGIDGKTISLDATVTDGRIEDMLLLGIKSSSSPMNGAVSFHTKIMIPPGNTDVIEKLHLDGQFAVSDAHFSQTNVQNKVNELSHRGRGEPEDAASGSTASDFRGHFLLDHEVMTLKSLSFRVPGVAIRLSGTYGLRDERLNLKGTASLQAKLSETTTGFKSFLLKALDPFFKKKNAGAVIPIKIGGTREAPTFGLDLGGSDK